MQYYALPRFTFSVQDTIQLYGNYHILASKIAQLNDITSPAEVVKLLEMANDFVEFYQRWCSSSMINCPISKYTIGTIERRLAEIQQ